MRRLKQSVVTEKRRKKTPVGKPGSLQGQRHNKKQHRTSQDFVLSLWPFLRTFSTLEKAKIRMERLKNESIRVLFVAV